MPVDAYSLAVSCGGRGVSSDIWPASLFGTRRAARCPARALRGLPVPRGASHHDSVRRHAGFPGIVRFRALRLPGRRWCRPHPRATADVAGRALRCVDRLRCSAAAWHWVVTPGRVTPSRRTLSSRHVAHGDNVMRGTLAPSHHAGTNFFLTETLAASGPKADSAPRHYRISRYDLAGIRPKFTTSVQQSG